MASLAFLPIKAKHSICTLPPQNAKSETAWTMGQLGIMNPDSNPGSEIELAAGGLGTLHQLGPLDRALCSKFTSSTRPHVITQNEPGKKDPKMACAGRGTSNLSSHIYR